MLTENNLQLLEYTGTQYEKFILCLCTCNGGAVVDVVSLGPSLHWHMLRCANTAEWAAWLNVRMNAIETGLKG